MDLGAIIFRFQTQGGQVFRREVGDADSAVKKLGSSSEKGSKQVDGLGKETDGLGKDAAKAKAPLTDAASGSKKLGDESERARPKVKGFRAEITDMSSDAQQASTLVGGALVGVGAATAVMVGLSVAKFAEFDEGMSRVGAATMASEAQLHKLGDAAVEAGAKSVFNAREAADAQTELAKAGVGVNDILGGALNGSLALAAAGELEVARAAEIAATTLTVFKLRGDQAGHVADLLAAGAGKAQGSVDDLALALNYIGPTFARLNIPIEDTVGVLGLLAEQGILGEKAGTGLRATMQALIAPTQASAKAMAEHGIEVYDAQGRFIGLEATVGVLHDRLGGLDEQTRNAALGTIFGAEAANVAGTLYQAGAEGVAKWTDNVNDQGYAAEQAARMTDNLNGDLEQLGGAFDSALIKTGGNANGILRDMVQLLTGLVDWYGSLPPEIQSWTLALGVGTAAVTLATGAFLLLIPKIAEYRTALQTLNTEMPRTAAVAKGVTAALGPLAVALTVGLTFVAAYGQQQAETRARVQALTDTLDAQTGAYTENTVEAIKKRIEDSNGYEAAKRAGVSQKELTDAILEGGDAAAEVEEKIRDYHAGMGIGQVSAEGAEVGNLINTLKDLQPELDAAKQSHENLAAAGDGTAESVAGVTSEVGSMEAQIADATSALQEMIDALNEANGVGQDAVSSNIAFQDSLAKVDEYIQKAREGAEGYTLSLDQNTQEGRDNMGMLVDLAAKSQNAAEKQFALDGNTDNYRRTLEAGRDALLKRARDLGLNADQAAALADQIYRIPDKKEMEVIANTAAAAREVGNFITLMSGKKIRIAVETTAAAPGSWTGGITKKDGGIVDFYANGGVRENHVAQIAAAGTMRVWAEPETGGEAYIPLAPSKRARSEAILEDVAERFGGRYLRGSTRGFADGGITTATGGRPIEIKVYGAPGMNEETLADRVASKFERALR